MRPARSISRRPSRSPTGSADTSGPGTFEPVGESWRLVVRAGEALGKYLAYKGSITVNGVSLTVNRVVDTEAGTEFEINLVPHTLRVTTLHSLHAGRRVNLEIDLIARYVERMLATGRIPR